MIRRTFVRNINAAIENIFQLVIHNAWFVTSINDLPFHSRNNICKDYRGVRRIILFPIDYKVVFIQYSESTFPIVQ